MIQISIIIPVYNNVTYLRECLTCLTSQTFTEFEVLCIDDASENKKTVRILQEYAEMDNRFKVIENVANLGAGATRNLGIEKSEGKYLLFLDHNFLQMLYYNILLFLYHQKHIFHHGKLLIFFDKIPNLNSFLYFPPKFLMIY